MKTSPFVWIGLTSLVVFLQPARGFLLEKETVAEHKSGLLSMDLAVDRVDRPYLLYHEGPVFHYQWFARQEGPERAWVNDWLDSPGSDAVQVGEGTAVDESFNEHVLLDWWQENDWYPYYPHRLRHGRRVGSQAWTWTTVASREQRDFARLVLFKVSPAVTEPWVFWVEGKRLKRAWPVGAGWQSEVFLEAGSSRLRVLDLQVDARGNVHVLYVVDDYPDRNLRYTRQGPDPARWLVLKTAPEYFEYAGHLALDTQVRPHVLYHYVTANWHGLAYLRCTDVNANTWQDEELPIDHCTDEWFVLDRFDEPLVVSRRVSIGQLFLHYRQGGTWDDLVIEEDTVDRKVGVRLDSLDRVQTGYRAAGEVRAAKAMPNQSPILSAGYAIGPLVAGHPAGAAQVRTVAQILNGVASDPDGGTWGGMGMVLLAGTDGGLWDYSLDGGETWTSLQFLNNWVTLGLTNLALPVPPSVSLRFRPWANITGTVSEALRFCAWDQFRGTAFQGLELPASRRGGASGFSSEVKAIAITVVPFMNSAPVLASLGPLEIDPLPMNVSDAANNGTLVADLLLQASVSDAEGDPVGIAVTGVDPTHGNWQFKLGEGAWSDLAPTPAHGRLLRPDDRVRFRPAAQYEGRAAGFTFRAWDQTASAVDTTVNGGSTAFSAAALTANSVVQAANHAPVLALPEVFALPRVYYNQPQSAPATRVSDLIAGHWTDAEGQACGVAIAQTRGIDAGTWQVELPGTAEWKDFPNWLQGFAYLLPPDAQIRYVPTTPGDRDLNPALKFYAWDQFTGTAGTSVRISSRGGYTSISEAWGAVSLEVRFLNSQSPQVPPGQGITLTVTEDMPEDANLGVLVSEVMSGRATDGDGNTLGGAIGYYLDNHGTWQYRLGGQAQWQGVAWTGNLARRLMLAPDSRIRFRPDPNWNGTVVPPTLQLHAWDQTWGTNGACIFPQLPPGMVSPFSDRYVDFTVNITPVPDAPVIATDAGFELVLELGGLQPAVVNVGDLIRDQITDADGDTCGLAVYAANHSGGRWEFSDVDPGTGQLRWVDMGELRSPWVWLVGPGRNVRFVAQGRLATPLEQGLFIRGWDQTAGQEGRTNEVGFVGPGSGLSKEWAWVSVRQRMIEFATVGDPGNAPDSANMDGQRFGAVNYVFRAGKYEVSNREYCVFLNAVARSDPYGLFPSYLVGGQPYEQRGIERLGEDGNYSYRCFPGREDLPACYVGYFSALRFANWLHNGAGAGGTEDGAYTLLGGTPTPTNPIVRNHGARVWLLSEDEWYKAAFYKGGGPDAGYWEYAVQTDDVPLGERPPGGPHSVNCISWVSPLGLPTMVGAYPEAVSAYGTYDQNGNLQEWIETPRPGADGLLRGSSFDWDVTQGAASVQDRYYGVQSWLNIGFRIGARAAYASNAAPVLRFEGAYAVSHDLGTVQWGHRIVELLGNLVSDLDDQVCGMAVVVVDRRCGEWQYGTVDPATGEATWLNLGNPTPQAALLLGPECRLRFIPNPATYPGGAVPGVSFRAWDRTSGLEFGVADTTQNGGETAFSAAVRTVLGRSNVAVVDDAGNEADVPDANSQRHGAVNHVYRISKYEVSNREYSAFLNAVAASDPLGLYPTYMVGGQPYALRGIERLGESGGYTYRCFAGREDLPACHISYFSAVRYVNWMHNGGGRGNTEDGAYTLLGGTSQPNNREPILRNPGTRVWLPSEDEWYKAAYYKGGGMGAGYWEYPVQTDLPPLSEPPPGGPHSVNCVHAPGPPGSPTNVGAYPDAVSAYGTHDQAGNVQEWLESPGIGAYTFARGGTFDWEPASAAASAIARAEGYAFYYTGFRVAGAEAEVPPPVPLALPPPPESGKPLVISWPSQLGWWYQLQEIGDLSQADKPEQWTNYLEPVEGNGGVMSREIVVSGEGPVARFFRVLTLPP